MRKQIVQPPPQPVVLPRSDVAIPAPVTVQPKILVPSAGKNKYINGVRQ